MKLTVSSVSIGLIIAASPAWAAVGESITKPMRYSACLAFISQTAQISGATPVNIIETSRNAALIASRLPAALSLQSARYGGLPFG